MAAHKFIDEIVTLMTTAIENAKHAGDYCACITYRCDSGIIDVSVCDENYKEVCVYHNNYSDTDHSMLITSIEDALPDWDDVEVEEQDMWQTHGFGDIGEFNKYIGI